MSGLLSNSLFLSTAAGGGAPVQIERSLRFNSSDSAFLSRTPAVAGNRRTWTWAGWVKRSALGSSAGSAEQYLFRGGAESTNNQGAIIIGSDTLYFIDNYSTAPLYIVTTQVLRDPSAWYHIVVAIDTTQATSSNRAKLYINGSQITTLSSATYPSQNYDTFINQVEPHTIGRRDSSFPRYFSGYLADIHFIDGQALTPSSFTEVSATTGRIEAKLYAGSFGTNGFWLPFSSNSTAAALGTDYSGNSNTWTVNNLSVTAGAGNDSLVDTPTSYGTDTGVGGEVRGNYATLNPLSGSSAHPLANGNLEKVSTSGSGNRFGTVGITSGKFYWENAFTTFTGLGSCGISSNGRDANNTSELKVYETSGTKYNGSSSSSYGASWGVNDVIGIAFDANNGTLAFYKNGVSQGTAFTGLTGLTWFPVFRDDGGCTGFINFGQRAFAYAAPSGFKALCDTNLGAPLVALPNTLMDAKLWTGTGATNAITGLGFSPDLLWIKKRSGASDHNLVDSVRVGARPFLLYPNLTNAENTSYTLGVQSLNSAGFTLGTDGDINASGATYVGWAWDAGTTTAANTQGSITSQVRANVSAGFSVVTYTGTGANATVGHGLGVAPTLFIVKRRDSAANWIAHTTVIDGSYDYLYLNLTNAKADSGLSAPTSTIFQVGNGLEMNGSGATYVGYCFAPVVGYSSFGSYTGNGNSSGDGPFVYLGFRPRFLMVKCSNNGSNTDWVIIDTARDTYNISGLGLRANLSSAEYDDRFIGAGYTSFDILSNGFKIRGSSSRVNASSDTYIYMAFAENPFQYARAR